MVKKRVITALIFVLLIAAPFATAVGDVAYIYKKDSKIDQNVIGVFDSMQLDVDMIKETEIPADMSDYEFIFIGDEKFSDAGNLPMMENSAVIMNHYHVREFGLTDSDGISKISSGSPLNVLHLGQHIFQVYTQGSKNRKQISYYYLDKNNKAGSVQSIATTGKISSGEGVGDVVAFVNEGAGLANGRTALSRLCFFGIVESSYWTNDARELFRECAEFVSEGEAGEPPVAECGNNIVETGEECDDGNTANGDGCSSLCENEELVECESDSDCPVDSESALFCQSGDVYKTITSNACVEMMCVESDDNELVEDCQFGCANGACLPEGGAPENHDVALLQTFSGAVNGIRIEYLNGTDILGDSLMCNEKYRISVTARNLGEFTENITFNSQIGDIDFDHNTINNLMPGDSSLRTRTVNMTLSGGNYIIGVSGALPFGITDVNASNNAASRNVFISCCGSGNCGA